VRQRYHARRGGAWFGWAGLTTFGETTGPSNKGMKLTKPSVLELRSLSPVFADFQECDGNGVNDS
jgi:hypothetical protein